MKFLAKIIIIAFVFLVGFYFGQQYRETAGLQNKEPVAVEQSSEQINVSLMLDFGDGRIKTFNNIALNNQATVFELLEKITAENDLEFKYKDYGGDMGAMIELIGEPANDSKTDCYWQFWVNNEYALVGASNYGLQDGDVVEWKYIKGQFN
ncbi:DUF4430 domain-containing protein [Candidatus Parcubacteria bacterium]|nr:DUF4430 domain-containing protein [Candidatus Parcubacteria bacterium]